MNLIQHAIMKGNSEHVPISNAAPLLPQLRRNIFPE